MSGLITLSCPSCGARLKISPSASSYVCEYCGNEYLIERKGDVYDLLEDFAKCPVCHRNDKVQKLPAIVASQTQLLEGTTISTDAYRDNDGNLRSAKRESTFTGKQASALAKQLIPPTEPIKPNYANNGMLIIFIIVALVYSTVFLCPGCSLSTAFIQTMPVEGAEGDAISVAEAIRMTIGGIFWLALGSVFFFLGIKFYSKKDKEKKNRIKAAYYEKKTQWDAAIKKYNRSYYCFRDGIVYDPESDDMGKPESLSEFLYETEK